MGKETQIEAYSAIVQRTFSDRKRTNILKRAEQLTIVFLLPKVPEFISPNVLTLIGTLGSGLIFLAFALGTYFTNWYLLFGIIGLVINWLGDSLDGRLAYYRNIPRRWYGFALDIIADWIGIVLIGFGYYIYAENGTQIVAFAFVALYGWSIIISQLRYKITNEYRIDSGFVGPTELRFIIALILIIEVLFHGSITYLAGLISIILLIINTIDSIKLLKLGDLRDKAQD
ncbi:CDP-alcohol phosphatidyltransferase family protein [Flavobacterium sp. Fl-318]|uniref:CDP-alcohol phosphatidyltransferase family protein n=1 Tax=Flavobacterium cupriresistens TaxID=2893885 RepID=A0ABU4R9M2_9FLAO|nr:MULTISPECIES: CDP-alcohol phosphatidyltransferase family protein [unclassified Flavobacterium]MDX6189272.1 CDP-alcohol phosphatidyltransferase family protein [Flavobacterium sp. Fl-318]UFH41368.1 CDP-alcohol phosphatidyltransferase family protein [Flavobacterium sp. F-323]